MTAYVTIPVATVLNVVKLPNAALRFKPPLPPEVVRDMLAKHSIDETTAQNAVVWKLLGDGSIEPVEIALGITDHAYTEVAKVVEGEVKPGDDVVTTAMTSKSAPPGAQGIRR
jgi:HlyD family secretion protein